jgi:hypothetical protein
MSKKPNLKTQEIMKNPNLEVAENISFEEIAEVERLSSEELEELKNTNVLYQNHLVTFATIELSKQEAISKLADVKTAYDTLVARLQEKYGEVNISLEDGKITKNPSATNI